MSQMPEPCYDKVTKINLAGIAEKWFSRKLWKSSGNRLINAEIKRSQPEESALEG